MEWYGYRLLAVLVITVCTLNEVEGGWELFRKNVQKSGCYGSGARRFVKPPSLQTCLTFCQKYRMRYCEFDQRDGFCYAKTQCTKMRESSSNHVLNIYKFKKGSTINKKPEKPKPPKKPSEPHQGDQPNKPTTSSGKPKKTKDPSRPLTMKVAILVADELADAFYSRYGLSSKPNKEGILKAQILTGYLTGLNTAFSDKSIGNVNVKIVIVHFSVVPRSTWSQWSDVYEYCKSPLQTALTGVDVTMYIVKDGGASAAGVKLTSTGRSITAGICKKASRCGVVKEVPTLNTAYKRLTAHEMGHVVGLVDEGRLLQGKLRRKMEARQKAAKGEYPYDDMRCKGSSQKSIMAAGADTWSTCSRRKFQTVFGSDLSNCLDEPAKSPLLPNPSDLIGNNVELTRKMICEEFKDSEARTASWIVHYKKPEKVKDCVFSRGECYLQSPPKRGRFSPMKVFDGTPLVLGAKCSKGFCYFGECLSNGEIVAKMKKFS